MTWIHFDANERPVPLPLLWDNEDRPVRLEAERGHAGLILLLCPDGEGGRCALALWQLGQHIDEVIEEDAFAYAILPVHTPDALPSVPLPTLQDRDGVVRRALASLLEFDTEGQPLMFVLDDNGRPVGAWAGVVTPADDIGRGAVERLRRAALRCPE